MSGAVRLETFAALIVAFALIWSISFLMLVLAVKPRKTRALIATAIATLWVGYAIYTFPEILT